MTKAKSIQKETMMNFHDNSGANETPHDQAGAESETYTPSYRLLLREPTVLLAGNPTDRTDVATAAILGYN
jgi:hypothetical protein